MIGVLGAAWTRALSSLLARPSGALAAALGLLLAGGMVGAAVETGYALSTGFARAQRRAATPDVVAHFANVSAADVRARLTPIAGIRELSLRVVARPLDLGIRRRDGVRRTGTAEVDGLPPAGRTGVAVLEGRGLSGHGGEALVERGLAVEWGVRPGDRIRLSDNGRRFVGTVVGIALEPDTVAYPLAGRPRVYITDRELRRVAAIPGDEVSEAGIVVADRTSLPSVLVQARVQSFGLTDVTYATRTGVRALVDEAGGLVGSLLVAFAIVAVGAAGATLTASANARVTRDLATIASLRAVGFPAWGLALSYGLESALLAIPAAALGVLGGGWLVSGPTERLLVQLNELAPPHPVGLPHVLAGAGLVLVSGLAAGVPALLAARRPIVDSLAGSTIASPRWGRSSGRPFLLGARLALARPVRLAGSVVAIGAAIATIFLMLGLARFLVAAANDPNSIGQRYSYLVDEDPGALAAVRATPGVAAAADRYETLGADAFDLGQPVRIVAFGTGAASVFAGRPLLEGRHVAADGEVEVGRGLSQALGLEPGGTLIADLSSGGELQLRVVGVVQELQSDGRVAYTTAPSLLAAAPGLAPQIAVRVAPDVGAATVEARLEEQGLAVFRPAGLVGSSTGFLHAVVALLRAVAVLDGFVCAALVVLGLLVLARERAVTIGVVRAVGGSGRQVASLLAGAAALTIGGALAVGYAAERFALSPLLSRIVERYGALPLTPRSADASLVVVAAVLVSVACSVVVARRLARTTVVAAMRER